MSWRKQILATIGPGTLCGLTLANWLRLLRANGFAVDPPYWLRAGSITWCSLQNSLFAWWERLRYEPAIRAAQPAPPLFILGIWRSGTTHLHNLLARDNRFACPSSYEMFYPHTFLTTEWFNAPFVDWMIPRRRLQDNVNMRMREPQEDEFALGCLTQMSPLLAWAFPRRAAYYDRFLTLRGCTPEEVSRWQAALHWLVQKLTYKHGRTLVLKSPGHTARIRLLLQVFPEARFVHIHRNPYDVFLSTRHLMRTIPRWATLQRAFDDRVEARILNQYVELFDAYFEDRTLIPRGRLHDVRYEALEANPVVELRKLYASLELGDFALVEPAVRQYLDSIAGYQKNRYSAVEAPWKEQIARRWRRSFEEWGYVI